MSSVENLFMGETASNATQTTKKIRRIRKRRATKLSLKSEAAKTTAADIALLTMENAELKRQNSEQTNQISNLQQSIDKLNDIFNTHHTDFVGKGSNLITGKIIELSKRNRHLYSDMEIYRTKCETLERELAKLKADTGKDKKPKIVKRDPNECEILREKLKTVTMKLLDVSNQNQNLKNEIKVAVKCLEQEVGDHKPLQNILSNVGGWRGRAQQILKLQAKVAELTRKLNGTEDDPARETQRQLEVARRCEVESLQKETHELKNTVNDLQFKLTAAKTRNKILLDECAAYRDKCQGFLNDQKRSEKEITELTAHLSAVRANYESQLRNLTKKIEISESKTQVCHTSVDQVLCEMHNKNDLLCQKDSEIFNLQRELETMQNDLRKVSGDFLFNCRNLQKHQYLAILNNLEDEKNQLLTQIEKLNERLNAKQEAVLNLKNEVEKQRLKICRLEGKLRDALKEKEQISCKNQRRNRIDAYYKSISGSQISPNDDKNSDHATPVEDTNLKLDLANERIQYLETKIHEITLERNTDVKELVNIIRSSKKFIFEALSNGEAVKKVSTMPRKEEEIDKN
ncbi:coiled-coil domain-containing protein 13 [Culicoides brevitarsis]|uniref:coiled-coil domain-containing protein 13 n=1 Tax=Culicoides brevitarsis TaxID=469753 RepID=UPI00307B27C3